MRNLLLIVAAQIIFITTCAQTKFLPPQTPSFAVKDTLHGVVLTDYYRWLENKEDPKVIEWTKAQHDYGIEYLKATQKMHAGLRNEIAAYIDIDSYTWITTAAMAADKALNNQ
jgi:prolyl oligopeptidase